MSIGEELRSRNFSIYGQWFGVLSILLCLALGISHIIRVDIIFIFGLICLVSGLTLIFIEIPILTKICPTSPKFDEFVRRFTTNYMRAVYYLGMSIVQWLSCIFQRTSLIAAAVVLLLTAICYFIAGLKGQGFVGSKTLGGQGVAQMIV